MGIIKFNKRKKEDKPTNLTDKVEATEVDKAVSEQEQPQEVSVIEQETPIDNNPQSDEEDKKEEATVLYEDTSKREECAKHFRMSDGTYRAHYYGGAVHCIDETTGNWEEIDNTLEIATDSGSEDDFEGYTNKRAGFKVKFAKDTGCKNLMSIQKGEHKIVMELENKPSATNCCVADICNDEKKNEVCYNNFVPNMDLQYILNGNGVKENIIVKERLDSYDFGFKLKVKNLELKLSEDNKTIEFLSVGSNHEINLSQAPSGDEAACNDENKADAKVIFTIPAPDMSDAKDEQSYDIDYNLTQTGEGEYILKVIPNAEWLNSSDRVFPVTIDPSVFMEGNFHSSTALDGLAGHRYISVRWVAISQNSESIGLFRFNMPVISNAQILSTSLTMFYGASRSGRMNIHEWTGPQWVGRQQGLTIGINHSGRIVAQHDFTETARGEARSFTVDVTNVNLVNGISCRVTTRADGAFRLGSENCEAPPIIIQRYIAHQNILSSEQHTTPIGRAGTGMVDLFNGNLKWTHENINLHGLKMPLNINHVYDARFAREDSFARQNISADNIRMGQGWKTNMHQYLVPYSLPTGLRSTRSLGNRGSGPRFVYVDHLGVEHILHQVWRDSVTPEIRSESGHLVYDVDLHTLSDRNGNKLVFEPMLEARRRFAWPLPVEEVWIEQLATLRLAKIIDSSNNSTIIRYHSNGTETLSSEQRGDFNINANRIESVTDGAGRVANFAYDSEMLLESITHNNTAIQFRYNSNRMTEITYPDGLRSYFAYHSNQNLLHTVRDQTGHRISYDYGNNRVTAIGETTNISRIFNGGTEPANPSNTTPRVNELPTTNISYDRNIVQNGNITHITTTSSTNSSDKVSYTFDNHGMLTYLHHNGTQLLRTGVQEINRDITDIVTTTPNGTTVMRMNKNNPRSLVVTENGKQTTLTTDIEHRGNITTESVRSTNLQMFGVFTTQYDIGSRGEVREAWDSSQIERRNHFDASNGALANTHINRRGNTVEALSQRFDNNGNFLSGITDYSKGGATTTMEFVPSTGKLRELRLDSSHVISYEYNASGLLERVITNVDGRILINVYNYRLGCLTRLSIYDTLEVEMPITGATGLVAGNNVIAGGMLIKRFEWEYDGFGMCTASFVRDEELLENVRLTTRSFDVGHTSNASVTYHRGGNDYRQVTHLDSSGRVRSVSGNGTVEVEMTYDRYGRTQTVRDRTVGGGNESTLYANDLDRVRGGRVDMSGVRSGWIDDTVDVVGRKTGRVVRFEQARDGVGGISHAIYGYGYSRANRVTDSRLLETLLNRVTLPDSAVDIVYGYDDLGRIERRTRGCVVETYKYVERGNSLGTNQTANVESIDYSDGRRIGYEYDGLGRVVRVDDRIGVVSRRTAFEYDSAGRVIRESNEALGVDRRVRYNAAGEIAEVIEGDKVSQYRYDRRGRLLSAGDLNGIRYDNLGNPASWRGNGLSWARVGNLTRYGNHEYRYDAFGARQEKRVNGVLSHIYYTEGATIHREDRPQVGQSIRYHYDVTGVTGFQLMQGSVSQGHFHFTKNVFGDVVGISDNGVLLARYEYDSWGNHRCVDANGNIITDPNHVGLINPFRWRSSYYDSETNLHYLAGRYYDPKLGVVLNPTLDEVDAIGGYAHSAPNPFAVFGNTFTDPTWGYPPLYDCECPPNEGCNYCGNVASGSRGWRWWQHLIFWVGVAIVIALTKGAAAKGVLAIAKFVKKGKVGVKLTKGLKIGAHAVHGAGIQLGAGVVHEGFNSGWGDIDWGVVGVRAAFGAIGGGVGAVSFKPKFLNFALPAGVGFSRSVAVDLVKNGGDWGQVNWGMAMAMGVVGMGGATFNKSDIIVDLSKSKTLKEILEAIVVLMSG